MEGWISLYRKLIDASWFKNSEYVHLWIYLLLKANYSDKEIYIDNKKVLVKRGQLITSRSSLAGAVHVQENKIYRILKCFENEHQIEQQTTRRYTVITIVNYDLYQKSEQVIEQQMNNKRTTDEQQMNTNNNNNNILYIYNNKEIVEGDKFDLFLKEQNIKIRDFEKMETDKREEILEEFFLKG